MAHDHDAILTQHQIRLDEICPLIYGQAIGADRMLRSQAASPTMGDDDRVFGVSASRQGNSLLSQERCRQSGEGEGSAIKGHERELAALCDSLVKLPL